MDSGRVGQVKASGDAQKIELPTKGKFGRFEVVTAQSDGIRASYANATDVGIEVKDTRSLFDRIIDSFWSLLGYDMDSEIEFDKNQALIGFVASGKSVDGMFLVDFKDQVQAFEQLFGSNSTANPRQEQDACSAMLKALDNNPKEVTPDLLQKISYSISDKRTPEAKALMGKIESLQLDGKIENIQNAMGLKGMGFGPAVAAFSAVVRLEDSIATPLQKDNACKALLSAMRKAEPAKTELERLNNVLNDVSLEGAAVELKEAVGNKIKELEVIELLESIKRDPRVQGSREDTQNSISSFGRVCVSDAATPEQKENACERLAIVLSGADSNQINQEDLARINIPSGIAETARKALSDAIDSVEIDHDINVIASGKNKQGGEASMAERTEALSSVLSSDAASSAQKDAACQAVADFVGTLNPKDVSATELTHLKDTLDVARVLGGHNTDTFKAAQSAVVALAGACQQTLTEALSEHFSVFLEATPSDMSSRKGGLDFYTSDLEKMVSQQKDAEAFAEISGQKPSENPRLEYMFKGAQELKDKLTSSNDVERFRPHGTLGDAPKWTSIEREALNIYHARASSDMDWDDVNYSQDPAMLNDSQAICERAFRAAQSKASNPSAGG